MVDKHRPVATCTKQDTARSRAMHRRTCMVDILHPSSTLPQKAGPITSWAALGLMNACSLLCSPPLADRWPPAVALSFLFTHVDMHSAKHLCAWYTYADGRHTGGLNTQMNDRPAAACALVKTPSRPCCAASCAM